MRPLRLFLLLVLPLLAVGGGQTPKSRLANVGDVAYGEIFREGQGHLFLNPRPCSGSTPDSVIDFHDPYRKRLLANKTCPNGRSYDQFSVEQQ